MRPAVGQADVSPSPSPLAPATPGPRSSIQCVHTSKALRYFLRPTTPFHASKPAVPWQTGASPPTSARPSSHIAAASAPTKAATSSGSALPPKPPKRPVRSRRLQPEDLDPEDPAAHTNFFPPHPAFAWEWDPISSSSGHPEHSPINHSGDPLHTDVDAGGASQTASAAGVQGGSSAESAMAQLLPVCYHTISANPNSQQNVIGGQGESGRVYSRSSGTVADSCDEVEWLRKSGGFLPSPRQVAELLQPRQLPTARQLLGLSLDYADHFFTGPDYRYAVDDQGRLVDMVAHIRTRVPARFDRARPSPGTIPPTLLTTSPPSFLDQGLATAGSTDKSASVSDDEALLNDQILIETGAEDAGSSIQYVPISDDAKNAADAYVPGAPPNPDSSVAAHVGKVGEQTWRESGISGLPGSMSVSDIAQEARMAGAEPTAGVDEEGGVWAAGEGGQAGQAPVGAGQGMHHVEPEVHAEQQEVLAEQQEAEQQEVQAVQQEAEQHEVQAETQQQGDMPVLAPNLAVKQGDVDDGARNRSGHLDSTTATPTAASENGSDGGVVLPQQQEKVSRVRAKSGGGYLQDPVTSAAGGEDDYLDDGTPLSAAKRHSRGPQGRGSLQAPLTPADALAARRSLMARNVGMLPGSRTARAGDPGILAKDQHKGGSAGKGRGVSLPMFRTVPIPPDLVLRVFPYCIGPSELFHGLWDLELLEQVRYVQRVEDADVVVHRRPQPGEKQFAYDTFRARAKSLGIPFSSLWNGSAAEIQRSLLPVFALYAGLATPEEVAFETAPGSTGAKGDKRGKKKRGARRIRL